MLEIFPRILFRRVSHLPDTIQRRAIFTIYIVHDAFYSVLLPCKVVIPDVGRPPYGFPTWRACVGIALATPPLLLPSSVFFPFGGVSSIPASSNEGTCLRSSSGTVSLAVVFPEAGGAGVTRSEETRIMELLTLELDFPVNVCLFTWSSALYMVAVDFPS
jgi:hypothetical protein